jgi:hypothetical protein
LETYAHFAARDRLSDVMLERMLAGVSTRRYARTGEPVGSEIDEVARSRSKSVVSREFVSRTRENLIELMSRPLEDLRLAVLMLDGIELKGRCCVVALGIDTDGVKHPLGLWDGSTENATVATLLANLVERGLDVGQGVLVVIDGAKALRKAVRDVLGTHTPVQRCVRQKERNVLGHLPERDRPLVRRRLRAAWALDDHHRALEQLLTLADELTGTHPGAAASLREASKRRSRSRGSASAAGSSARWPPRPLRVEDRDRPPCRAQRQALAIRRHVPALDGRRHARGRGPVPHDHRLHRPGQARRRRRTRRHRPPRGRHPHQHRTRADRDRGAGGRRFPRLRQFHSQDRRREVPRRAGHPRRTRAEHRQPCPAHPTHGVAPPATPSRTYANAAAAPYRPYGGVVRELREADGRRPALMRGV